MVKVVPAKKASKCFRPLGTVAPFNVLDIRHPALAGQVCIRLFSIFVQCNEL